MPTNIFSTYSTGENRVTASFLAVLQSLSLSRIDRLLQALLSSTDFSLVQFENQPSKGAQGVPDARIFSSTSLLIETKTERNGVRIEQLKRHLQRLDQGNERDRRLLVLTPDDRQPAAIDELDDPRLAWTSFGLLDQAINELLNDPLEVVSEREAFLLRELQAMLQNEKLVATANDVVIVAAREAWPEYQKYHAYVCQANRSFQAAQRLGFYCHGAIQMLVPRILEVYADVEFTPSKLDGKLKSLATAMLENTTRTEGTHYEVMFLSDPDSSDTVRLDSEIQNDIVASSGRTWAFTMSQRYVNLDKLMTAQHTSELVSS